MTDAILEKVIIACLVSLTLSTIGAIGGAIVWVFKTTKQNKLDINQAFKKIRRLETYTGADTPDIDEVRK